MTSTTSSVKVGVNLRPLLPKELGQNCVFSCQDDTTIAHKGQVYTFDHVFGMDLSQRELYMKTAHPMMKSFLEGYNVTIMAYGQTGSGKTYTMGTADTGDGSECQGLIPRFLNDLFDNLAAGSEGEELLAKVHVSIFEIYGDDVYDLISRGKAPQLVGSERQSLHVREDENGRVFVQGLVEMDVTTANEALDYLTCGIRNRITAATSMNAGSSRSHAIFTVTLEQTIRSSKSEDDVHVLSSRLTFVDLAGSERIKRIGTEKIKESIQINSGLFCLGQVITALAADDQRSSKNNSRPAFINYRNSKLTLILKDALGGNSQTLFLACISPAECNESETMSTIQVSTLAHSNQCIVKVLQTLHPWHVYVDYTHPVRDMFVSIVVTSSVTRFFASGKDHVKKCLFSLIYLMLFIFSTPVKCEISRISPRKAWTKPKQNFAA